jgi:hypothetical protein
MKRVLLLAFAIFLCGTLAANASVINLIDTDAGNAVIGTIQVTRTSVTGGGGTGGNTLSWDELDLNFSTLTGPASGLFVYEIGGTWTGDGGSLGVSSLGGSSNWGPKTENAAPVLGQSYVNLGSVGGASNFARGSGSGGAYASFSSAAPSGDWYTANPPSNQAPNGFIQGNALGTTDQDAGQNGPVIYDDGVDETLLAKIYVTPGKDVDFVGRFDFSNGVGDPASIHVSFTTVAVPEPGTLVLLATGLLGMVAYAWRKRK